MSKVYKVPDIQRRYGLETRKAALKTMRKMGSFMVGRERCVTDENLRKFEKRDPK